MIADGSFMALHIYKDYKDINIYHGLIQSFNMSLVSSHLLFVYIVCHIDLVALYSY